mgnify:FL=1
MRLCGFLISLSDFEAVLKAIPAVRVAYIAGVEIERKSYVVAFVWYDGNATLSEQQVINTANAFGRFQGVYKVWFVDKYSVIEGANGRTRDWS